MKFATKPYDITHLTLGMLLHYLQWWKYKFGDPGTVKMPGAPCFVLGTPNRLSGPYPDFSHLLQEVDTCTVWGNVTALGHGTDLNQAFRWKFWHFGAPERFLGFWGPRNGVPVRSGLLSPLPGGQRVGVWPISAKFGRQDYPGILQCTWEN